MKKFIGIASCLLFAFSLLSGCGQSSNQTTETTAKELVGQTGTAINQTSETSSSIEQSASLRAEDFLGKAFSGTAKEGEKIYEFEMGFDVKNLTGKTIRGKVLYMRVGQEEGFFDLYDQLEFTPTDQGIHVSALYIGSQVGVEFEVIPGDDGTFLFTVGGKECVVSYNEEMTQQMNQQREATSQVIDSEDAIKRAQKFMVLDSQDPNFFDNYSFYEESGIQTDNQGNEFYTIRVRQNAKNGMNSMAIGFINVYIENGHCAWQ
ncbi:hypothetical protein ACWN8V_08600 [Vagococcus elongatus]|uniref:DUF5067 domain-containing protein n=1 Tax=Vagococcus elongatus TaxID=180344 RepID=A0A430ATE4_9ENTE|nr:hypothetical protein [Vagococcus elongatus]RSU11323.1 hypothetical protein CBF29_08440 [Vagococcus elongatus]